MADLSEALAKATIAAALIGSGKFDLSEFDATGRRARHGGGSGDPVENLLLNADVWGDPDHNVRDNRALMALAKLSDAIYRAVSQNLAPR
jgi:hypothetical protein